MPTGPIRFRVMTYNTHRAIGVDRRFRPERLVEIIASHDPDLVLLQEVDDGAPRSHGMDLARVLAGALRYPFVAVGHNVALRKGRYGNATLSRFPILRERNIDLTIGRSKRRGCQHTEISLAGPAGRRHLVDVFNVHLGLSSRQRDLQVALLARSRELASLPPEAACLLGGDFNDWRSQLKPYLTEELRFRSATERFPGSGRTASIATFPSFFPQAPLDRLYFRGPVSLLSVKRCRLRISRIASDHLPVIADFEVR